MDRRTNSSSYRDVRCENKAELTLFLTFPGAVVDRVCFGGNFEDTDPDDVAGRTIDVVIVV